MENKNSCILYFYERDNQFLVRILEVEEKLSEFIHTLQDAKDTIKKLEAKNIIKSGEMEITIQNANYLMPKIRDAVREYNKLLNKKVRWFLFDDKKQDFVEIIDDFKKFESKFQSNLFREVVELSSNFNKAETIEKINKKKAETKYVVCECKTCGELVVVEYRETFTPKCPKCKSKIEFDSKSFFFDNKEEAYKKQFEIIKSKPKAQASISFYCYKGVNYRFNNNDLISLLKNILSNLDYNNILTTTEKGVPCFKETFKQYLLQCDSRFADIISEDESAMANLNIVQAFYFFLSNKNIKHLRILTKPFLLFSLKDKDYYFRETKEYIDYLYNQQDPQIINELIKIFTDSFYFDNFFKKSNEVKGSNLIDLSYLIYKYKKDYWYIVSDFKTGEYGITKFGPDFLNELYKHQEQEDVNKCLLFLQEINDYELFGCKFSEFPFGEYPVLCIIQQQINNASTFNYKGIIFSTNIEEAAQQICEYIKNIYLDNKEESQEYLILKELLSDTKIIFKLFNYATSEILLKLSEDIQLSETTLLDLYLSSYGKLSMKTSIFLIKGVKGTIVEIARNAINNNWLNNLLVDADFVKIKNALVGSKALKEIKEKSDKDFADILENTR